MKGSTFDSFLKEKHIKKEVYSESKRLVSNFQKEEAERKRRQKDSEQVTNHDISLALFSSIYCS